MHLSRIAIAACLVLTCTSCQRGELTSDPPTKEVQNPRTVKARNSQVVGDNSTVNDKDALDVFEKRILPIFNAKKPSSCTECHLSGVELADYIQPTQEKTFASLVSAGLINIQDPDNSKILTFINRRPEKPSLVTDEVRKQEYVAFQSWIRAAVKDRELLTKKSNGSIGPQVPDEVIRHARKDRVMASFIDNIWTEIGRCAACHSPDRNQKQVEENGDVVSWIVLNDPSATLEYMVDNGLIDTDNTLDSRLLTKPTQQVDHGGGQKMVVGDRSYKQFRRFIDDYVAVVRQQYTKADQIPSSSDEVSIVTDIWLKIEGVPSEFDKMLLQVDLYRETEEGWSEFRVATSDRPIFGGGNLWQHSLSLTAPRGSQTALEIETQELPPGRYLAKLYIDKTGKLEQDFTYELSDAEFVGQIELESQWPAGYGQMTVVRFPESN